MKKFTLSALILISSGLALADCPAPNQIHLKCGGDMFSHVCNWQAPWYEGFTEGQVKPLYNAQITKFLKVIWGRGDGQINGDGTTLCYYSASDGTIVMMGENNWGHVPKPKANNWSPAFTDKGHSGEVCTQNCHFHYGS